MTNLVKQFSMVPTTFTEAMEYAKLIATSSFVPKEFRGKPADVMISIQYGHELGIPPLQSLQNIAVINGRPCIYGDLMLAVCQQHPDFIDIEETDDGETATCIVKRKGCEPHKVTFSMDDANKAGLVSRSPVWKSYPKRMRQMRARGFALRDKFSDALKGLISREEAEDYPQKEEKNIVFSAPIEKKFLVAKENLETMGLSDSDCIENKCAEDSKKASSDDNTSISIGMMSREETKGHIKRKLIQIVERFEEMGVSKSSLLTFINESEDTFFEKSISLVHALIIIGKALKSGKITADIFTLNDETGPLTPEDRVKYILDKIGE